MQWDVNFRLYPTVLYTVVFTSDCKQNVNNNIFTSPFWMQLDTVELASNCIQNSQTQAQTQTQTELEQREIDR